jgi:hypothetical protein
MRVAYDTRIVPEDELGDLSAHPPTNETITELDCAQRCVALQTQMAPWFLAIGGAVGLTAGALVGHWLGKRSAEKESGRHGGHV